MDLLKDKYQIVVAKYNEDIKWLLPFKSITIIYNKGEQHPLLNRFETVYLNNVGRESHTYLYHIVENYDKLADKTIFFQGNIIDHIDKILDIEDYFKNNPFIGKLDNYKIDNLKKEIYHYGKYKKDLKTGNLKKSLFLPYEWLTNIIGINIPENITESKVVWNANFSISKELILSKPKAFYQNILRYISDHSNPEEGHFLERTWYMIFHYPITIKETIQYLVTYNVEHFKQVYLNYKNIHIWTPIYANYDIGINYKIYFLKSIQKYITINTIINNNSFHLKIKGKTDISILIELENDNKYEIIFSTKTIIKDYNNNNNNNNLFIYNTEILQSNNFISFDFSLNDKFSIKSNQIEIITFDNIYSNQNIKNIKLKSIVPNSNIYLLYDHIIDTNNNNQIFIYNNNYENINTFYKNYYLHNYIERLF